MSTKFGALLLKRYIKQYLTEIRAEKFNYDSLRSKTGDESTDFKAIATYQDDLKKFADELNKANVKFEEKSSKSRAGNVAYFIFAQKVDAKVLNLLKKVGFIEHAKFDAWVKSAYKNVNIYARKLNDNTLGFDLPYKVAEDPRNFSFLDIVKDELTKKFHSVVGSDPITNIIKKYNG